MAKQIRISAKLDKSGFQKELNQLLKKGYDLNLNGGNFKSVVNDITKELNKLKSTLNNVNGNTFDNTTSGINKTKDAVKDLNSELTRMSSKNLSSTSIIADKNGLSEINKYKDGIAQTTSEVIKNGQVTKQVITENISQFNNLKNQLQNKLLTAKSNNLIDSTVIDKLQAKLNSLNTNSSVIKVKELQTAINNLGSNDSGIVRLQQSIIRLEERIKKIKDNKLNIMTSNELSELRQAESQLEKLRTTLSSLKSGEVINGKAISNQINIANNSVRTLENSMRELNTVGGSLSNTFKNIFSYALGGSGIYLALNSMREAINTTISLDDSLRDLKRVTDLTSSEYEKFMKVANQTAIALGTTTSGAIDAVTRFSQLGYSFDEASNSLSKYALILSNVADMSATDASSAIVSVLKGFQLGTEDVSRIVDVINESGNKFALDSSSLAEGLRIGAANLSIAGNDLEEASAMIIAGTEILQDSGTVSNGLKTISMRLKGISQDGEELNASLGDLVKDLTGVDLTDANGEFRSTYDILVDISKVFDTLDSKEQSLLLEEVAGKHRANVLASVLQNSETLTKAYDTLKNAENSANEEQDRYINSLSGKINALKESLTAISMQMIDSDMFKGLINGATTGVQATSKLIDTFGTFPSIVGITTASLIVFNSRIRENTNSMLQMIPGYGKATTSLKGWSESISKNITQLQAQKASLKTAQTDALATGESTTALGRKMLKLNSDLGILKTGLVATKVATVALNVAMSMALTMGISAIISGLGSLIDKIVLTRSELDELNSEFVTTNSETNTSKVIDLVNTYEELQNTLSTLKEGTSSYKDVEDKLASTQESILSIYPSASKAIEYNTEAKRLNLEATKKLIDKDLELAKADALDILEKNDTKTDTGLDKAIEQYQEYYKVLEKVNDLAEKEETKSVNIESKLSDSGELLVNAKDVDVYKKRVESLNDTLEASYEAYKILGVSNDKYAEKAKKVGEVLGYTSSQTEDLINKLKETDDSADETAKALEDINGDGIIDATDQMLKLAMATDEAKSAVENLADSFSGLQDGIELLKQMKEEYSGYGMLDTDTMTKVLSSGDNQLIALLGDEANFIQNINSLLDEKTKAQDEVLKTAIAMAQAEISGSQEVVDATNAEAQAIANLENTKANISNQSVMTRANAEASLTNANANTYNTDESNYINKENSKMRSSFDIANERMRAEKEVVDNNSQNYNADDKNYVSLANSKITSSDSVNNAMIDGTRQMVNSNNSNYSVDAKNYANYINSKIASFRAFAKAQNQGLNLGTLGFKKESEMVIKEFENYKNQVDSIANSISNTTSSYVGSGGVGGGVSHGSIGSGSSGNKGSSGSTKNEVEDMESLVKRYHDLEDAINDVNNEIELNKLLQDSASGRNKIKLMEEEIRLYKKQQQAIKDLISEQKKEAQGLKNSLSSQGVAFNSQGDISNYNQILTSKVNWANSLSGDAKSNAIEQVKALEEAMKSYDELVNKTIPSQEQEWESLNATIKEVHKTQADLVASMEKEISDVIEYELNKRYDKKKEALNREKELYNKEYEEANFEEEMNTERNKLADIQAEIDKVKNDTSRAGQLRLKQLMEEYEEQQKVINDKIKEQQNQAINDRFDQEEELLDKELEDMTSSENLSKLVAEAISSGMIKIGNETINVKNSMNEMLKETEVGFTNVAIQQSEWIDNLEQIKSLYADINSIMNNAGISSLSTYSIGEVSRSRSVNDINITTGGVTIQGNADSATLSEIQNMLNTQAKEIYKNVVKQLS